MSTSSRPRRSPPPHLNELPSDDLSYPSRGRPLTRPLRRNLRNSLDRQLRHPDIVLTNVLAQLRDDVHRGVSARQLGENTQLQILYGCGFVVADVELAVFVVEHAGVGFAEVFHVFQKNVDCKEERSDDVRTDVDTLLFASPRRLTLLRPSSSDQRQNRRLDPLVNHRPQLLHRVGQMQEALNDR